MEFTAENSTEKPKDMEEAEKIINELTSNLKAKSTENEELKCDIKTLLDFKTELEGLVEQQSNKINSLNSVKFVHLYLYRHERICQKMFKSRKT